MSQAVYRPHLEALESRLPPGDTVLGILALKAFALPLDLNIDEPVTANTSAWKNDLWEEELSVLLAWQVKRPSTGTPETNQPHTNDLQLTAPAAELPEIAASRRQIRAAHEPIATPGMGFPNMLTASVTGGTAASVHGEFASTRLANHVLAVPPIAPAPTSSSSPAEESLGSALFFEPNVGQTDGKVDFLARAGGYTLFLTPTEAVMSIQSSEFRVQNSEFLDSEPAPLADARDSEAVVRMQILGANPAATATGVDQLITKVNYYLGNDPDQWHAGVPTFAKVQYQDVYPGIDLVYYGKGSELEYDFVVAPGVDPNQIALSFSGADSIAIDADGSLVVQAGFHEIRQPAPFIYQDVGGVRQQVMGEFRIPDSEFPIGSSAFSTQESTLVTFQTGAYDVTEPLVIDPAVVLAYSTYLGGSAWDQAWDLAVDSLGSAFVAGQTASGNFPVENPVQESYAGSEDAFIAKFTPDGSALEYATWLGGTAGCSTTGTDRGLGVAVDLLGNAYITGYTASCNFPILNGFQTEFGGSRDGFLSKLDPFGALVYSSFIGGVGSQFAADVAVDGDSQAYITGTVLNEDSFPIVNAIQPVYGGGGLDYFVAKVSRDGRSLLFSTFLGGISDDGENYWDGAVALDPFGNVCITGNTKSGNFPLYNAYQSTHPLGRKGFVTKLTADGSAFVFSTFLSGSEANHAVIPRGIATDAAGNVYVTGSTSAYDFPVVNPFQDHKVASWEGFISKFKADGSDLLYSTYLGGSDIDMFYSIAVDSSAFAYVTANTGSTDIPKKLAFQPWYAGDTSDAYVAKLVPEGNALAFASYLGGNGQELRPKVALDENGGVYVSGYSNSTNFPVLNPFQATKGGSYDAYLTKINQVLRQQAQPSPI